VQRIDERDEFLMLVIDFGDPGPVLVFPFDQHGVRSLSV
jgi:hypothetical protein